MGAVTVASAVVLLSAEEHRATDNNGAFYHFSALPRDATSSSGSLG